MLQQWAFSFLGVT
jgi:hypothetical protein